VFRNLFFQPTKEGWSEGGKLEVGEVICQCLQLLRSKELCDKRVEQLGPSAALHCFMAGAVRVDQLTFKATTSGAMLSGFSKSKLSVIAFWMASVWNFGFVACLSLEKVAIVETLRQSMEKGTRRIQS
jgi:hypothetical protein